MPTVKEIFERMPDSFVESAATGLTAKVLFDITGEAGGQFLVAIDDGRLRIIEGGDDNPDLTIRATAQDYVDISTGALNEQLAFMTGRITARGSTALAFKLPRIFKR